MNSLAIIRLFPIWSLVLANWCVHKGFKLLLVPTFWRMLPFCSFLWNCFPSSFPIFHHVLTWFTTCFHWKTSSLKSNPLRHSTLLVVVEVFFAKGLYVAQCFPIASCSDHLKGAWGFQRGFLVFLGGFCLYVLSKWRDCWIAMMIWHTSVLDKRYS